MSQVHLILLIEDNEDDVLLFNRAVARLELPIKTQRVSNGQEAIDYLLGATPFADRGQFPLPHVILVDLKMPICDGFDFLAWKRDQVSLSCIPAIVMTSSSLERDIRRSYELGAHSFTTKVSGSGKLADRISALRQWWFENCVLPVPG